MAFAAFIRSAIFNDSLPGLTVRQDSGTRGVYEAIAPDTVPYYVGIHADEANPVYQVVPITDGVEIQLGPGGGTAPDVILRRNLANTLEIVGTITGATIGLGFTEGSVVFTDSSGNAVEDNANFFWNDASNQLGIGIAPSLLSAGVGLHVQASVVNQTAQLYLEATNSSAGSQSAELRLRVPGDIGVTGDPRIVMEVLTGQSWSLSVDNSDGDRFKFRNTNLTPDVMTIGTNGFVGFSMLDGEAPQSPMHIQRSGSFAAYRATNSTAVSTGNAAGLIFEANSSTQVRQPAQFLANLSVTDDATRQGRLRIFVPVAGTDTVVFEIDGPTVTIAGSINTLIDDAVNTGVTQVQSLTHTTSGAPGVGIGVGFQFVVETSAGNNEIGAIIEAVTINVGAGTEALDLVFRTMLAGAAAAPRMTLNDVGLTFAAAAIIEATGNLTLRATAGNDVLIGDDVTILTINGSTGFGIFEGGLVVNEDSTSTGDLRVESDGFNEMLLVDASLNAIAVGRTAIAGTHFIVGGNVVSAGGAAARALYLATTLLPGTTGLGLMLRIQPTATANAGAGTHSLIAGISIDTGVVTAGVADVTNTAMLYIDNAMTAVVTGANYAIWVDNGLSRFDGNIDLQGGTLQNTTGNLTISASAGNDVLIGDDITILTIDGGTGFVGVGVVPARAFHVVVDDADFTGVTPALRITHTTSGTAAAGIGVALEFEVETSPANREIGARIDTRATDISGGSEDFDLVFLTMLAGGAVNERMRVTSAGNLTFDQATVISTATGNLTISVPAGNDVLIGDSITVLYVDGGADLVRIAGAGSGTAPITLVVGGASTANGTGARLSFISDTTGSTESAGFEFIRTNSPGSGDGTVTCFIRRATTEFDVWTAGSGVSGVSLIVHGLFDVQNGVVENTTGNLTLRASAGNDVLIGDDATLFAVDGGLDSIGIGNSAVANVAVYANASARTISTGTVFSRFSIDSLNAVTNDGASITIFTTLSIDEPNWTQTSGSALIGVTLYVQAAPTEGSLANYALLVDSGNARFDGDVFINGSGRFGSETAAECGFTVGAVSVLTVGSLGSMVVPVKTTTGAPNDAAFGNINGAFGFNSFDNTLEVRDGTDTFLSVAVAGFVIQSRAAWQENHYYHPNMVFQHEVAPGEVYPFVNETLCLICGEAMVPVQDGGGPIVGWSNGHIRGGVDLHAVWGHLHPEKDTFILRLQNEITELRDQINKPKKPRSNPFAMFSSRLGALRGNPWHSE